MSKYKPFNGAEVFVVMNVKTLKRETVSRELAMSVIDAMKGKSIVTSEQGLDVSIAALHLDAMGITHTIKRDYRSSPTTISVMWHSGSLKNLEKFHE